MIGRLEKTVLTPAHETLKINLLNLTITDNISAKLLQEGKLHQYYFPRMVSPAILIIEKRINGLNWKPYIPKIGWFCCFQLVIL